MNNLSKIGLAFLAGAAAGAVAGILLAPDKGSETRKNINKKAHDFSDAVTSRVKKGWEKVSPAKKHEMAEPEEILS